jgi:putative pyruvate formate lyase activating enzyme
MKSTKCFLVEMQEGTLSSKIKIYKSGIHRGEESLVTGNSESGMIYFSGCHLSCRFCYTPETSVHSLGQEYSLNEFDQLLWKLRASGARNFNLVSPTHLWSFIERSKLSSHDLPIVLKVSGYESENTVKRMAAFADVFVPDFKVWDSSLAESLGLPQNYRDFALAAIVKMMETHQTVYNQFSELKRGILLRHLMMPGAMKDSFEIIRKLHEVKFNGVFNLMTNYIDEKSGRLIRASQCDVNSLLSILLGYKIPHLLNGKEVALKGVAYG